MKYIAALKHYKTNIALAAAARVSKQAVTLWSKKGIVPEASAWRLHAHSKGRVAMNLKDYERVPALPPTEQPTEHTGNARR